MCHRDQHLISLELRLAQSLVCAWLGTASPVRVVGPASTILLVHSGLLKSNLSIVRRLASRLLSGITVALTNWHDAFSVLSPVSRRSSAVSEERRSLSRCQIYDSKASGSYYILFTYIYTKPERKIYVIEPALLRVRVRSAGPPNGSGILHACTYRQVDV